MGTSRVWLDGTWALHVYGWTGNGHFTLMVGREIGSLRLWLDVKWVLHVYGWTGNGLFTFMVGRIGI